MKIVIQAADLDHKRIDGTRVYLLNVLKHLGRISPEDDFLIYHRKDFNPELAPPNFTNYKIKKVDFPFFWTQTRFAYELWKEKPDALWMPMHNIPLATQILKNRRTKEQGNRRTEEQKNGGMKTTVTIHDLAFKYFPDHFPKEDLWELNFLTKLAIEKSDKIIAVSNSTKNDILKFYPKVKEEKIKVIYHGFDSELFQKEIPTDIKEKIISKFKILNSKFILYVGAIQPRKNLEILIDAFDIIKKENPDIKLVLAGGKAWLWERILERIKESPFQNEIILTDTIPFQDLGILCLNASAFIFPSLYEGFGIPVLEAMASKVPVICSSNSSLPEAGGDAALYFDAKSAEDLADKIKKVLGDENLRSDLISRGLEQIKKFSWEKCARETLEWIKKRSGKDKFVNIKENKESRDQNNKDF